MMRTSLALAALLSVAGCLNTAGDANSITLDFDMTTVGDGFLSGVANVAEANLAAVDFVGDLRTLPAPLPSAQKGLYLAGTNSANDLFLFQEKHVSGLFAGVTYNATLQVQFVTNYHEGCTTGAGPNTIIKAGVSNIEPISAADNQGVLRMSIDVGAPADKGDFTRLGDIQNGLSSCPANGTYAQKLSLSQQQDITFTTDPTGGFFLWVGTHNTAQARSEIYITAVRLILF